ncbi:MAG: TerB family tellurite resistance protein [Cycloclasticus sp.]|nr:TerB family tellurite resistance protein [Cycloclasticus sp.]
MSEWFFKKSNAIKTGPYTFEQIKVKAQKNPEAFVMHKGAFDWKKVTEVSELGVTINSNPSPTENAINSDNGAPSNSQTYPVKEVLSNFLDKAKSKLTELKNEALKYKSKEFLNAALGGSALVILADGRIDAQEKIKMMSFIENHESLSIYNTSEVVKTWKDYMDTLEMDTDIGTAKAMTAIGKIKGKPEQAKLVLRMVCAIGASDGDFDADEKRVASKIALELGLNPSDFDLS